MGSGLADGVSQGQAGPGEFRTAPLWGLGQRIFFLHDGRTSDLLTTIQAHKSGGPFGSSGLFSPAPSEANGVINLFNSLTEPQKQDVLNFLRSLSLDQKKKTPLPADNGASSSSGQNQNQSVLWRRSCAWRRWSTRCFTHIYKPITAFIHLLEISQKLVPGNFLVAVLVKLAHKVTTTLWRFG